MPEHRENDVRDATILELYAVGRTQWQIAEAFSVSAPTVSRWMSTLGIAARRGPRRVRALRDKNYTMQLTADEAAELETRRRPGESTTAMLRRLLWVGGA